MLAAEFKQRLEQITQGTVEVEICENKEVLIRPAVDWNSAPNFARELLIEFLCTPLEER